MIDVDENLVAMTNEMVRVATQFKETRDELNARVFELEQKLARGGAQSGEGACFGGPRGVGAEVAELEGLRALAAGQRGKISLSIKALTTDVDSTGGLVQIERFSQTPIARRRPSIRQVLGNRTTTSNSVEYSRRVARSNGAAMQVEGAAKGESGLAYELQVANVRTLATWIPASKQVLDDSSMLAALIDYELRRNLRDVEESQILNGDGTGVNLDGLLANATAFSAPFAISSPTMIDTLLLALGQLETNSENEGSFIAVNPLDWRRIQSIKSTDGAYLSGSPFTGADIERLWALPMVPTPGMALDKFLVGDGLAAAVFDRQQATIEVSTEDRDNFIKNMVTIRAEERLSLAIFRPDGFVFGDFGNVA